MERDTYDALFAMTCAIVDAGIPILMVGHLQMLFVGYFEEGKLEEVKAKGDDNYRRACEYVSNLPENLREVEIARALYYMIRDRMTELNEINRMENESGQKFGQAG